MLGRESTFCVRALPEGANAYEWLENAFREIHAYALHNAGEDDYVGLSFNSANLTQGPAGLSFRPARDLTYEDIWRLVSSVAQSAGGLDIAQNFSVSIFNVEAPRGCGSHILMSEHVRKRSILSITNSDNSCFPRSLVCAQLNHERRSVRGGEAEARWNAVRRPNSVLQRSFAQDLTERAGVVIPREGCGIREIECFQRFLAADNIAIVVYNADTFGKGERPLFDGSGVLNALGHEPSHKLNIMYYESERHYNPILCLKAAAGSRKDFCIPCNISYKEGTVHRCTNKCPLCNNMPPCVQETGKKTIRCDTCKRSFFGKACFEHHRAVKSYDGKNPPSVCNAIRFCEGCNRTVKTAKKHECGVSFCKICSDSRPINHLCFMQPLSRGNSSSDAPYENSVNVEENEQNNAVASEKKRTAFVFYDFETRQDVSIEGTNIKIHIPTLCVAHQICESCAKVDDLAERCEWCGVREFIFRRDPVKEFVEFVTRPTKSFNRIICIAHNAKAFDAQFILKHIVENHSALNPRVTLNGTKIIVLTAGRAKFIDSVNYMPMRLSELPKAFGLPDTCGKGVFPHLFNTIDNQTYVGPMPDVKYYAPETMHAQERERFLAWHAEMLSKNTVFDFQREILEYCRTDVIILRRACMAFRKIFLERGNVCPFVECTTIASTCMRVFRKNFLRKEVIGIIPTGGYRYKDKQSRKAIQWLVLKERELGRRIIHAGHGREHRLTEGMRVDGYYECDNNGETQRHVLQFHGCFFHGCTTCYRVNHEKTPKPKDTYDDRFERTLAITAQLRRKGYIVTEKWECDFDKELRENREMREFVENHPIIKIAPLDPRDAFFGGRTGNVVTRYETSGNEKIRYVDVCSLYPYVLKTGVFPIGHPDIFVGVECAELIGSAPDFDLSRVEGLVRCRVLPPRDLFHPVLPYRLGGKLLFALCRTCCEIFSRAVCTHDDPSEREFEGTWCPANCVKQSRKVIS